MKKTLAIVAALACASVLSASASAASFRPGGHCAGFMGTYIDGKQGGHSGLYCS